MQRLCSVVEALSDDEIKLPDVSIYVDRDVASPERGVSSDLLEPDRDLEEDALDELVVVPYPGVLERELVR